MRIAAVVGVVVLVASLVYVFAADNARRPACPPARWFGPIQFVDYTDVVIWRGQMYDNDDMWRSGPVMPPELEEQLGTIGCSISEWSEKTGHRQLAEPSTWADGTATHLPVGTTLHKVKGLPVECAVGARDPEGGISVFVILDPAERLARPDPCSAR